MRFGCKIVLLSGKGGSEEQGGAAGKQAIVAACSVAHAVAAAVEGQHGADYNLGHCGLACGLQHAEGSL